MNNENKCVKCKTKISDFEKNRFVFMCGNCKAQDLESKGELFGVYCKKCKQTVAYFDKNEFKSNKKYYCSKCGGNNIIIKKNEKS